MEEIKHFTEVKSDIMDVIEFRKLWLIFSGWKVKLEFKQIKRTFFDLVVEKNNKRLGIVALEDEKEIKYLSTLRTYLNYVDEMEFLTNKESVFWEVYNKFARKRKWKVVILDGSGNNYKFVHFK